MSDAPTFPIYPRYCFNLAPTVNSWCFLRATEVHRLDQHPGFEGENFYFYKSLPIKWVRIAGVVVAIDEYPGRRVYTVDDSSGACIECTVTTPTVLKEKDDASTKPGNPIPNGQVEQIQPPTVPNVYPDIDIGSVVDVKGGLSTFRDEKQINIEKMTAVKCTADEVTLWEKRSTFRRDILDKPWVLSSKEIRRCRKEAERSEEEADRKRRKLRARIESHAAKQLVKSPKKHPQQPTSHDEDSSRRSRPSLRQVLRNGAEGKYDALGL